MPEGTVKFFLNDKGYGFIIPEDGGPDMFVHAKQLGDLEINCGDSVYYEILKVTGKRPEAKNVRVLGYADNEGESEQMVFHRILGILKCIEDPDEMTTVERRILNLVKRQINA